MGSLRVAVAVRTFPNPVQTYILRQLAGFRKTDQRFTVIAESLGKQSELPKIVSDFDLLRDVRYVGPKLTRTLKQIALLPFQGVRRWRSLLEILTSQSIADIGPKYRVKSAVRFLSAGPIDWNVIHSHSLFSSYDLLFYKKIFGIPIVATYHGQVPIGVTPLRKAYAAKVFENVDLFIVNTKSARLDLAAQGCDEKKIQIVPQGLLLEEFPFRVREISLDKPIRLVTVGRLSGEKGHRIVLRALVPLLSEHPHIEYHIVGDGPEQAPLKNIASELSILDRVIFHGFKTGGALNEVLSSAHICILPSISIHGRRGVETQGVVLQEAQALGIPVVASRIGGIPEVIEDRQTGLIFDPGDFEGLSSLILELIHNSSLYRRLADAGRQAVDSRFQVQDICSELKSVYEYAIKVARKD